MAELNVTGAADRLLANGTNTPGKCLQYVWQAIGRGAHYITGGGSDAFSTWRAIPENRRHVDDRNVPKDMPAYLGTRAGNNYGDVIISRGDGTFAATDWPSNGRVGICTLEQRERQTGRPYLGWGETMGGHDLVGYSTAGDGGTPIPPEIPKGNDMTAFIIHNEQNPDQLILVTYTAGIPFGRYLEEPIEREIILALPTPVPIVACKDEKFAAYLDNTLHYEYQAPIPLLGVKALVTEGTQNGTDQVDIPELVKGLAAALGPIATKQDVQDVLNGLVLKPAG